MTNLAVSPPAWRESSAAIQENGVCLLICYAYEPAITCLQLALFRALDMPNTVIFISLLDS
jgi:hypothetical protein